MGYIQSIAAQHGRNIPACRVRVRVMVYFQSIAAQHGRNSVLHSSIYGVHPINYSTERQELCPFFCSVINALQLAGHHSGLFSRGLTL
jgi:hypothetical protein